MAFKRENLSPIETGGNTSIWAYKTDDVSLDVFADGYFNDAYDVLKVTSGILVMSRYGTFLAYVSDVSGGDVDIQVSDTPTLQGDVVSQNEITTAEINVILISYGIEVPLRQSLTVNIHDPTDVPNKSFLCTYDQTNDQWYYEKMTPCP